MEIVTLDGSKPVDNSVEDVKIKSVSLFDFIGDITFDKQYLLDESTEKAFVPYMVNKGLSQNVDTIMFANEMNKNWHGSKDMVHDFLFYSISKKKRYGKWAKADNTQEDDIKLVMSHYTINRRIAISYLGMLTKEQINKIRDMNRTGGRTK
jgi:hypothetical protein